MFKIHKEVLTILVIFYGFTLQTYQGLDSNKSTESNSLNSIEKIYKSFQDGDIIFQTSTSAQSKAIQLATKSIYTHMGIIYTYNKKLYVYEAFDFVKLTPLKNWIARGKNNHYVVKRLKNSGDILTSKVIEKMKIVGKKFNRKNYDIYFEWSDNKIYCSELVWKIYKEATGIEIASLQNLSEFDLTDKHAGQK